MQNGKKSFSEAAKKLFFLTKKHNSFNKSNSVKGVSTRKIIVHAGFPKTGTTSIQQGLFINRKVLFSDYGILYPSIDENHTKSLLAIFRNDLSGNIRFDDMSNNEINQYRKESLSCFNKELMEIHWDVLIISGEGISTLKKIEWSLFINWLSEFSTDIEIYFGIRNHLDLTLSVIQQTMKAGYCLEELLQDPPILKMQTKIERVIELIGRERVHVWNFDKGIKNTNGMLYDFCSYIGLPYEACKLVSMSKVNKNVSLRMNGIRALDKRNQKLKKRESLNNLEFKYFAQLGGAKFDVEDELKQNILQRSKQDIDWLNKTFFDQL